MPGGTWLQREVGGATDRHEQTVNPSALSLVDDAALRLQRCVGLVPARSLGVARRAVFFALLTWPPTLVGIAVPTLVPILVLLSTQGPIKEILKKILGALLQDDGRSDPDRGGDENGES